MATASELIKAIVDVTGLPEPHVSGCARYAREAGLISQGGRGVNAAHMTVTDAANLLIASCAAPMTVNAVETIERYRPLVEPRASHYPFLGDSRLDYISGQFGTDLETLLRLFEIDSEGATEFDGYKHRRDYKTDTVRAQKAGVQWPDIVVSLDFHRPFPAAAIRTHNPVLIERKWVNVGENLRHCYGAQVPETKNVDLSERITVTDKTLRAVARTIARAPQNSGA